MAPGHVINLNQSDLEKTCCWTIIAELRFFLSRLLVDKAQKFGWQLKQTTRFLWAINNEALLAHIQKTCAHIPIVNYNG